MKDDVAAVPGESVDQRFADAVTGAVGVDVAGEGGGAEVAGKGRGAEVEVDEAGPTKGEKGGRVRREERLDPPAPLSLSHAPSQPTPAISPSFFKPTSSSHLSSALPSTFNS